MVKAKPELANVEPFKTVRSGNRKAIAKLPQTALLKIAMIVLHGDTRREYLVEIDSPTREKSAGQR